MEIFYCRKCSLRGKTEKQKAHKNFYVEKSFLPLFSFWSLHIWTLRICPKLNTHYNNRQQWKTLDLILHPQKKADCMQFEKYLEYIMSMSLQRKFETRPDWKKEPYFHKVQWKCSLLPTIFLISLLFSLKSYQIITDQNQFLRRIIFQYLFLWKMKPCL